MNRLSNREVMTLPYEDLVWYCDQLFEANAIMVLIRASRPYRRLKRVRRKKVKV